MTDRLKTENRILRDGIKAMQQLMNESSGVYGLHLNGALAPWHELERDGPYGEWLKAFNDAEDILT